MRDPIDHRPMHLNLLRIHFYPNALISISHRISGALLALCLLGWLMLANAWGFGAITSQDITQTLAGKLLILFSFLSLYFHWLAGIRHLMIDHWPAQQHRVPQALLSAWTLALVLLTWLIGSLVFAFYLFNGDAL